MSDNDRNVPILLWPFYAIWRLVTFILELVGRLLAVILGLALMAVGVFVTLTIVAAPIGIPIAIFGFLLLIRAVF